MELPGASKLPLRNSRPQAGNLHAARRAARKGPWVVVLPTVSKREISILTAPTRGRKVCFAAAVFYAHGKTAAQRERAAVASLHQAQLLQGPGVF